MATGAQDPTCNSNGSFIAKQIGKIKRAFNRNMQPLWIGATGFFEDKFCYCLLVHRLLTRACNSDNHGEKTT
ncbi:hypothetical protein BaRGS_00026351 [Batillaria attramentaria]|uniref:Uncharacterized protein n=1 Tax=Batillaria attramentaria TaxID=370345 RepID=A0ABD0K5Q0_9CAEN